MSRTKEFYHAQIAQGFSHPDDSDYAYEEYLLTERAEELGRIAHKTSTYTPETYRYPAADPALRALLESINWQGTATACKSWLKGWDRSAIERTAAADPYTLGELAAERGIEAPAGDSNFLSWVTAGAIARGAHLSTDEWIQAVTRWTQGWKRAASDLAQVAEWEAEEADREMPRWALSN